jgi:hypothetical protein
MKNSKTLAAILVLQVLILFSQWFGSAVRPVRAQIPDTGAQNVEIIDSLKSIDGKMDKLISILQDGNLQVKVAKPDENKDK